MNWQEKNLGRGLTNKMLAPTHSVFGIFLTLIILAIFGVQWSLHWSVILFAIIGSIMPDIDHPKSIIGRMFKFVSIPIERRYGHRTITHSLIGWLATSIAFALIIYVIVFIIKLFGLPDFAIVELAPRWVAAFSIAYFSHLILDMLNRRGSQLFWPDPGRDVIPRNPKFRPESGSKVEVFIFIVLLFLVFLALPISKYGIQSSLRWLLATPGSAIQEVKNYKIHSILEFNGIFKDTNKPAEGQGEILGIERQRLIILYQGSVYTISDEFTADIIASNVRVKRTKIPLKIEHKEFKNETRAKLLSQIPKGALVSGTIQLPDKMEVVIPSFKGGYKVINQQGNNLILKFASKKQIDKLALSEAFEIQRRKDQAELSKLQNEARKIESRIKEIETGDGLTPLGKEALMTKEDQKKQDQELTELKNRLEEANIRIDEVKLKIASRKFVFSGEVFIRQ